MEIFWILFGIVVVAYLLEMLFKYKATKRMTALLEQHEYELYDQIRNGKITMFVVSHVNLRYLDLTKAILRNDVEAANRLMEIFKTLKMNNKQKETIYCRAFYFFLSNKKYEQASMCHDVIMSLNNANSKPEVDLLYHIYILKDDLYLDDLLSQYEQVDEEQKGNVASLLAEIYSNKNDEINYNKYLEVVKEKLK